MGFLIILSLSGCFKRDNMEDITIYTTIYPLNYITDYLYGDNAKRYSVYPSGVDVTTYELTNKQIEDYSNNDLFVFNSLDRDRAKILSHIYNNNHCTFGIRTNYNNQFKIESSTSKFIAPLTYKGYDLVKIFIPEITSIETSYLNGDKEESITIDGDNVSDLFTISTNQLESKPYGTLLEYFNTNYKIEYVPVYFKINVKTNITKPLLSKEMKEDIKTYAKDLFRLINAKGIIEIDFLIDENNMKLYFSKISTLPYHMASHIWKKNKVSESELLENMINIAINERNRNREFITHIDKNLLEGWDLKANKMK